MTDSLFERMSTYRWGDSMYHHPGTMKKLNMSNGGVNVSQTQCHAGIQGWSNFGMFYEKALPLLIQCALDVDCITPKGSSRRNHLQDQTVLNAVFSKLGVDPCREIDVVFSKYVTKFDGRGLHTKAMFRRIYQPATEAYEAYLFKKINNT